MQSLAYVCHRIVKVGSNLRDFRKILLPNQP